MSSLGHNELNGWNITNAVNLSLDYPGGVAGMEHLVLCNPAIIK